MRSVNIPKFLIIGACCAGAKSLYEHICQNPLVKPVNTIRYFTDYWYKGKDWYFEQFPTDYTSGELCTDYLLKYVSAYSIKADISNIKLIAILRNPVDRILCQSAKYHTEFSVSLKVGHYANQLKNFVNLFGDNLLVLQSEKYFNDEWNILQSVFNFLNIPQSGIEIKPRLKTDYTDSKHYQWLTEYYKSYNDDLWKLLGEKWNW